MRDETQHRIEQLKKATDRIQKEIEEVTEREHELKNVGSIKTLSHDLVDSKVRRMPQALSCGRLKRTISTPQILEPCTPLNSPATTPIMLTPTTGHTNGITNGSSNKSVNGSNNRITQPLRFASTPGQKGLMHRFIETRGRIYTRSVSGPADSGPIISLNPESIRAFNRSIETRNSGIENREPDEPRNPPTRKGFVPVEKKIQRELNEMREREDELRLMRSQMLAKSQPNLVDIVNNSDNYSDIYESGGSMRSGTSSNTLNEDEPEKENKDRHKPHPRRRSNLIAQWENLIAAKKEASEKGVENGNTV